MAGAVQTLSAVVGSPALGQNVTIYPGDSKTLNFSIRLPDGTNPTFVDPVCEFTVTKSYRSGPDLLVREDLVPTLKNSAWSVSVPLSVADTAAIVVGRWFLQLRLLDADGSEETIALGFFLALPIRPTSSIPPRPSSTPTFYFLGF